MKDDRGELDLTSLAEQHAKEIWAFKEQIADLSKELTVLRGTQQVVAQLSNELVRMKKRAQEAEGENTIIKGIGSNSPEMKDLRAKIKELESTLSSAQDINDNHQRYNGKLQARVTELEGDNKKLSKQIDDQLDRFRRSGL
jgi:F0F1-type ATP synthase epsilon subunit|tara:strand:+ start:23 stop:445 length:423 start_codon:yes stop_codon:yes gene_type:complete